jgi:hypothetical protein
MAYTRLDLVLLPEGPDVQVDGPAVLDRLRRAGVVMEDGRAGPAASRLVDGGFVRAWVESDDLRGRFYGNQIGGFRVACPTCGASVAEEFGRTLEAWRRGGPRWMACHRCAAGSDLANLRFAPAAGFGRAVLRLADVGRAALTEEGWRMVAPDFVRVVARRVNG